MAAGRKISRGTGVLATIGSTAPFVGLFGTVWGIMDSFIGISKAHTTNLAVVAPGIAEALLATALGLVAAIPAVMIYNVLARSTAHYRALIGDASAQVMKLVSRDLDRAQAAPCPMSRASRRVRPMAMRLDHGEDELDEVHDINVTPFIDVILVLLIIFMVAAPLATVDISVDLPSSNAEPQRTSGQADLSHAQGRPQPRHRRRHGPARRVRRRARSCASGGNKDQRIFLRADRSVPYGDVMAVMNDLRAARYLKVALVGLETRQAK